jgi:hypothetical protein
MGGSVCLEFAQWRHAGTWLGVYGLIHNRCSVLQVVKDILLCAIYLFLSMIISFAAKVLNTEKVGIERHPDIALDK